MTVKRQSAEPIIVDYEYLATAWHDSQKYGPAPRFRKKLLKKIIKSLDIESVLEIGCGQPDYIKELSKSMKFNYTGSDISKELIESNKKDYPKYRFEVLDVEKAKLGKKYDLVIASEVLEHINNFQEALINIAKMAKKYVLITVPSSTVYQSDREIGHYRHYQPQDLLDVLWNNGFKETICYQWGFPFLNLYKWAVNNISPDKIKETFYQKKYTASQKITANLVFGLFHLNIKDSRGGQIVILAERMSHRRE